MFWPCSKTVHLEEHAYAHMRGMPEANTSGGGRQVPKWKDVKAVTDFESLLLAPTAQRWTGHHKAQPLLLRAEPGTGKSWSMLQLRLILAKRQRGVTGAPALAFGHVRQRLLT